MSNLQSTRPTATTRQPTGILSHLKNAVFTRNNFVDGSYNAHYHSAGPTGLDLLHQHISLDAAHDANIVNKPECSADTRIRILKELEDWMDNPEPEHKIIWLHGPAGAGKSAIAQTTMQNAEKKGYLGASFFFLRSGQGRNNADRLFPTISHQLACKSPELAQRIDQIVLADRDLPVKSLEKQFSQLIDGPLRECGVTTAFPVVGIDGVDECDNELVQAKFLNLICNSVKTQLPLRFLISSRPEPRIKAVFQAFNFITREIVLETSEESLNDVSTFLNTGFAELRERYSHFMHGIPQPWPSEADLLVLRERSSGHFIYPATVLKFIGENDHGNPIHQLDIVLRRLPKMTQCATPYPDLDRLYHHVLSRHPHPLQLRQILMFFIHLRPFPYLLDELLTSARGTAFGMLSSMHSLIRVSESDSHEHQSGFHHASFQDFLLDPNRSHEFHIDEQKSKEEVDATCLNLLLRWIDKATLGDQMPNSGDIHTLSQWQGCLKYLCTYLGPKMSSITYSRVLMAIPSKPVIPSKAMICILHSLEVIYHPKPSVCVKELPQVYFPNHRLHMVYKEILLDKSSTNFQFLLTAPYGFILDLSLTLWKPIYGIDPSAFIHKFYHVLEFTPGCIRLQKFFQAYIVRTSQIAPKYLKEQQRKPLISLIGTLVQTLVKEQDQEKYQVMAMTSLGYAWRKCFLPENVDNVILLLADLKKRPKRSYINENIGVIFLWIRSYSEGRRGLYEKAVAKISKELLFLTTDSPPLLRIHPCFLNTTRHDIKSSKNDNKAMVLPEPQFESRFPRLSSDFQFFDGFFRHAVLRFIMHRAQAGDLYVPTEIICQDLNILPADIGEF